jgi:hypothetical protein
MCEIVDVTVSGCPSIFFPFFLLPSNHSPHAAAASAAAAINVLNSFHVKILQVIEFRSLVIHRKRIHLFRLITNIQQAKAGGSLQVSAAAVAADRDTEKGQPRVFKPQPTTPTACSLDILLTMRTILILAAVVSAASAATVISSSPSWISTYPGNNVTLSLIADGPISTCQWISPFTLCQEC